MGTVRALRKTALYLVLPVFAVLVFGIGGAGYSVAADGKGVFNAKKCGSCHQTKGPATEKTFADQAKKKGPELWYAGSKFKLSWLEGWLAKPTPIRPLQYNSDKKKNKDNHAKLSGGDAKAVATYLMTLTAKETPSGVIKGKKASPKAKLAFQKKYGCIACHTISKRGKKLGGLSGPDLSSAGERLNGDWVYSYLKEPKVYKPVKKMPIFAGIINDAEMKLIALFVATQKVKKKKKK